MTGSTLLMHLHQHGVTITVEPNLPNPLAVPASLTLHPVLATTAREEGRASGGQGLVQRQIVHPAHHKDLSGGRLLNDGGDQSSRIAFEHCGNRRVKSAADGSRCRVRHAPIVPTWPGDLLRFPRGGEFLSYVSCLGESDDAGRIGATATMDARDVCQVRTSRAV